jgi:hypothetical protein
VRAAASNDVSPGQSRELAVELGGTDIRPVNVCTKTTA